MALSTGIRQETQLDLTSQFATCQPRPTPAQSEFESHPGHRTTLVTALPTGRRMQSRSRSSTHREDLAKGASHTWSAGTDSSAWRWFHDDAAGRGFVSSIRRRSARSRGAHGGGGSRRAAAPIRPDSHSSYGLYAPRRPRSPRVCRRQCPEVTSIRATMPPGRHTEFDPIRRSSWMDSRRASGRRAGVLLRLARDVSAVIDRCTPMSPTSAMASI